MVKACLYQYKCVLFCIMALSMFSIILRGLFRRYLLIFKLICYGNIKKDRNGFNKKVIFGS